MTVPAGTITTQGQGTLDVTARLTDVASNVGPNSGRLPGDGRHGGADGGGCDHGDCHRQRHLVERLYHQRHDADGVGHARFARPWRDGAGQQRWWGHLVRCHHQHGRHLELQRSTLHGTSFTYQARIVDTVGNVGANTDSQAVTIDTVAPGAPSITTIPENSGGGINAAEASNGTPVVVGLAGTGAAAGDTLSINWGGQTVTYTLLAATSRATARR